MIVTNNILVFFQETFGSNPQLFVSTVRDILNDERELLNVKNMVCYEKILTFTLCHLFRFCLWIFQTNSENLYLLL